MLILQILQIVVALIIIIILAVIAFMIYNSELTAFMNNMLKRTIIKKETTVFDGIFPITSSTHITYNTYDPNDGTYIDLSPSINQLGGAEYTYNFWIFIPSSKDTAMKNRTSVLFVRGSDVRMTYRTDANCELNDLVSNSDNKWFLVKNPLVKLVYNDQGSLHGIVTEFNSVTSPDAFHMNPKRNTCNDINTRYDDMLGIHGLDKGTSAILDKWNMITIVLQESNPSSNILYRNKALVKLFLNGYQYLDKNAQIDYSGDTKSTTMKHNYGSLFVNPKRSPDAQYPTTNNIAIADLHYFNYALTNQEIIDLFNKGFTKKNASIPSSFTNSMDVYAVAELQTEKLKNVVPY